MTIYKQLEHMIQLYIISTTYKNTMQLYKNTTLTVTGIKI